MQLAYALYFPSFGRGRPVPGPRTLCGGLCYLSASELKIGPPTWVTWISTV
jgi:hypothetical protein